MTRPNKYNGVSLQILCFAKALWVLGTYDVLFRSDSYVHVAIRTFLDQIYMGVREALLVCRGSNVASAVANQTMRVPVPARRLCSSPTSSLSFGHSSL